MTVITSPTSASGVPVIVAAETNSVITVSSALMALGCRSLVST